MATEGMTIAKLEDLAGGEGTTARSTAIRPQHRKLHDPSVTFEEYFYFAAKTRAEEDEEDARATPGARQAGKRDVLKKLFNRKKETSDDPAQNNNESQLTQSHPASPARTLIGEKSEAPLDNAQAESGHMVITDEEWSNASRLMRSASWGACFYLITTDILGPYGVGFALGTLGWGPGITLYTVFGVMAGVSGYLLWKTFLGLDSHEFPLRNYGDLAFRIYGSVARHLVNLLQAILLVCILGQVIIQQGQGISQVSNFKLCYAVCIVIFAVVGFVLGQIRTLKNLGWLTSMAVYLNLMVMFISMGVIANSPPNYAISKLGSAGGAVAQDTITPDPVTGAYPPVIHYGGLPDPSSLVGSLNGLMQGVFAYGGAQLFVEFMAEMRRPRDFIKAMWAAQFFIYAVYLIYGCFVYHFQGQYSFQTSYQGVSVYGWQVVGDMLAVLSGLIAAALYGNIGIKVLYNSILMDLFKLPPLTTKLGKTFWMGLVPVWWTLAFVIAGSIPDYFGYVSVLAAICIVQFCYSFPPILAIGYFLQRNAIDVQAGDGFDPVTGLVTRKYTGARRILKSYLRSSWSMHLVYIALVIYAGGSLATAGLGAYAAIESMIEAFEMPQINAFTCTSPLNLNA